MPPKGYVGIKLTAQRKLMIAEVMRNESDLTKATAVIDYCLALAQDVVRTDAEELENAHKLPDFVNYYVGDATALTDAGVKSPLMDRERMDIAVGKVSWRMDSLNTIRNIEPTIVNLADAIDFALAAYLMRVRSNTLDATRSAAVKKEVATNQVMFRQEVTEFLQDNMSYQRGEAKEKGTLRAKKTKKQTNKQANRETRMQMLLLLALQNYKKAIEDKDKKQIEYYSKRIERLERIGREIATSVTRDYTDAKMDGSEILF